MLTRNADFPKDRGQVVPLIAVLLVLTGAVGLGLVAVGGLLLDRSLARTAADAAVLAAGLGSDEEARQIASDNGAEVVSIARWGDEVEVKVRVGRAHARARARTVRELVPPTNHPDHRPLMNTVP